jgi:cyclophilin family peptidyl-prolyl cis-trans isomerase/HEAT repeat protein
LLLNVVVAQQRTSAISSATLLRIIRAEDTRTWDDNLQTLLTDKNAEVRLRASLAAGRIGNDQAVPSLIGLLKNDEDKRVRAMAAFALGEIESITAADALISAADYQQHQAPGVRARAVEALGKIAAAVPKAEEARAKPLREAILSVVEFEAGRRSASDDEVMLLGATAALRARPENVGRALARYLRYYDPRVRADTANALARLKLSDGNEELRELLVKDPDPIVRANAARVLGATEDKSALKILLEQGLKDADLRVRVSVIRALASLKDRTAASTLLDRGEQLLTRMRGKKTSEGLPSEVNEILEIATALGRLLQNSQDDRAVNWLRELRVAIRFSAPEVEVAYARISPQSYQETASANLNPPVSAAAAPRVADRRGISSIAQGLGELAALKSNNSMSDASIKISSQRALLNVLNCQIATSHQPIARRIRPKPGTTINGVSCSIPVMAVPDVLRAYAAFKASDAGEVFEKYLALDDVVVRSTAADLIGEMPPDESRTDKLITALPLALGDKDLNDAAMSIIDALGKQKSAKANEAIKTAFRSPDILVRRKAAEILKANGAGDFSDRVGLVQSRNTLADYQRAIARIGEQVRATVNTSKGSFVIEFIPEAAPLTVDNFVMLARRGYFNGQVIPRVVPNFVIQTGDPRGDQNGGPGYAIRCEINEEPYTRGAVGMALSGKDTGGSQWFVTHSPQPHLDGGYTVFGRVISGMDVVDNIVRGDTVRSISINVGPAGTPTKSNMRADRKSQ